MPLSSYVGNKPTNARDDRAAEGTYTRVQRFLDTYAASKQCSVTIGDIKDCSQFSRDGSNYLSVPVMSVAEMDMFEFGKRLDKEFGYNGHDPKFFVPGKGFPDNEHKLIVPITADETPDSGVAEKTPFTAKAATTTRRHVSLSAILFITGFLVVLALIAFDLFVRDQSGLVTLFAAEQTDSPGGEEPYSRYQSPPDL